MWKWLVLGLAVYVLYRLFANDFLKKKKENAEDQAAEVERKVAAGEMVKDPECGTYVSVDGNISVRDGDKVYRFCSYECRDKFLERLQEGGRELPPRDSAVRLSRSPKPVIVRAFFFCRQRARAREVRRSPGYRGQCLLSSRQDSLGKQKSSLPAPNQLPM